MKILTATKITKIYGDKKTKNTVHAVNSIDLAVLQGEFVGVMGASGSGKTTLLNMLCGLMKPTTGSIEIMGTSITSMDQDQLALFRRHNVGYIFQDYKLLDSLTIRENIMLPLVLDKINTQDIQKRTNEMIKLLALEDSADQYPVQTSGGQKQRAAIGRALIGKPSIIFADEPTGNLDTKASRAVMECFTQINQEGNNTLLMVTHDPYAASFCNRIIFIKDGKIHMEIVRKEMQKQFFEYIMDCLLAMGGEENDA